MLNERSEVWSWLQRLRRHDPIAIEEFIAWIEPTFAASCEGLSPADRDDVLEIIMADLLIRLILGQYEISDRSQLQRLVEKRSMQLLCERTRRMQFPPAVPSHVLRGGFPRRLADRVMAAINQIEKRITDLEGSQRSLLYQRARGADWAELARDRGEPIERVRKSHARIVNTLFYESA